MLEVKPDRCPECGIRLTMIDSYLDLGHKARLPRYIYTCPKCGHKVEVKA